MGTSLSRPARDYPCPSPDARFVRKPNRVSDGDLALPPRSGLPMPIAGRSQRPSWASLARWFLRFALQAARRNQTPAPGHGQPLAAFSEGAERAEPVCPNVAEGFLKWPQVFNLRNSTSGVLPV